MHVGQFADKRRGRGVLTRHKYLLFIAAGCLLIVDCCFRRAEKTGKRPKLKMQEDASNLISNYVFHASAVQQRISCFIHLLQCQRQPF